MLSFIPLPYRILGGVAILAAVGFGGYVSGRHTVEREWALAKAQAAAKVAQVEQKQAEVTTQVVTKYVDRVKVIHDQGAEIIKEVPVYVKADANTELSGGFRVLHDAAASGSIPDPARIADAPPVAASAVAETVASNYKACRENAEQLTGLQEWVKAQAAVK